MNEVVGLRLEIDSTGDVLARHQFDHSDGARLAWDRRCDGRIRRANRIQWTRTSSNAAADAVWNAAHTA
jgi:hypothetical protein